ncbi:GNAT family N-acetyltransferase [Clostridium sp. AL.422]|uniref:GNAT family N-acetyltransferase n=1 Tax=Clostridium TaxID=1485 RepID=UPI00293DB07F|nr:MULTISPECIES: GNAT family N-acetyltransferase [unclassified Clostridium]MDV4149390.1 GNAT family N-acetyltransferase [Clostridium sp. AL.422]
MNLEIKKLSPSLVDDYVFYFDNVAFRNNPEWSLCYCLEGHEESVDEEIELTGNALIREKDLRRERVRALILNGVMNGYLVYNEGNVIAWCNANDKSNYIRIKNNRDYWLDGDEEFRIKTVYCFNIAPDYRGKGIAKDILKFICDEASLEGYDYIEGYPRKEANGIHQFHGPIKLYESMGFTMIKELDTTYIFRKIL